MREILRRFRQGERLTLAQKKRLIRRFENEILEEFGRRVPNPGRSEFVHGNIASMGRFFDDPPADYHKVGDSPLATAVAEPSQSDFAANAGRTHPQTAINPNPIPVEERRTP